ncbi:hypothetical protein NUW58_g4909 [Xylaria curta]|uniref:Uncharacterized protein n=1 Tax=Xylaria curta TaxID=42375 RepID=A0ACC1P6J0_9PEZI|nr:hypothetical protein NUW58_g4909 [Xylaria curta]
MVLSWSSQPLKAMYIAFFVATSAVRLLLRLGYYLPNYLRPLPEWSLTTSVMVAMLRDFFDLVEATHMVGVLQADIKRGKDQYVRISPLEGAGVYTNVLKPTDVVKPVPLGALWYPNTNAANAVNKHKIVLHFPSGAFIYSHDPHIAGKEAANLINKCIQPAKTLIVPYRISTSTSTVFPAAIQDAVTVYNHVLQSGIEPRNVILCGDSAGANVVLALMRYLEAGDAELPLPEGAMVWSPWLDVTAEGICRYTKSRQLRTDCLTSTILQHGLCAYVPRNGVSDAAKPYISPLHHLFRTHIPIFIQTGTAELFYDEMRIFAREMSKVEGNTVRYHETVSAPHDILLGYRLFGFKPEAERAASEACNFLGD